VPDKTTKTIQSNFAFRLKTGDYEIEINGSREEVLNTIKDLSSLVGDIDKAFEKLKPRKIATLTVKTEAASPQKTSAQQYPKVPSSERLDETILKILETDWGKWRPRTIDELDEALKSNGIEQGTRTIGTTLTDLVKREKVRRWNTSAGNVYILAEKEALRTRRENE
jgi:hypothetical protein